MAAIAHLSTSPRSLETALAAALSCRPSQRIFVVAPTRRLLDHLERSLAQRFGALAGVHFLHHLSLAHRVVDRFDARSADAPPLRELDPRLLCALFEQRARSLDLGLCRWLASQPSAFVGLLATFRDLRDAGFSAREAGGARLRSPAARDTLELFRQFEGLLAELATLGFGDAAAIVRGATEVARTRAPACSRLLHYGAYELIGVHLELMRALSGSIATEWFVPTAARDAELPLALVASAGADPRFLEPSPRTAPATTVQSLAGPREELRFGLRRLLAWHHEDAVAFADMALLVRSPGPYARALAAEMALLELAPDTSFDRTLAGLPASARLLPLLHALTDPESGPARRRAARAWPERDVAALAAGFAAATSPRARLDLLAPWTEPASAPLVEWFTRLRRECDALLRLLERAFPDASSFARWLIDRLEEAPCVDARPASGLRVLDFHQARGLPLRRAVIVGCNERLLPRREGDDFFLPDADRAVLAEASGRPIPRRGGLAGEELLFDVVRGAVDERLVLTHARSDETGRSAAPSPFLRRLAPAPVAAPLVRRHPIAELEQLHAETGLLRESEALVLAANADAGRALALARDLGGESAALEGGLAMVATIDASRSASLAFDGGGLALPAKERYSATELEQLGRCPLQYFFAVELRLKNAATPDAPDGELPRRELGNLFHDVLCRLYTELLPKGVPPPIGAFEQARARIPALLREALAGNDARDELLPEIAPIRLAQWEQELVAFVARDLERMRTLDLRPVAFEEKRERELVLGELRLPVKVRFDRRLVRADGAEHLGDYKLATHAQLKPRASITRAVRGEELQLPLYALARLDEGATVAALELLALEAESEDEPRDSDRVVEWDVSKLLARRADLADTLATLVALRSRGTFPLVRDPNYAQGHCGRCDFRRACRHSHGATGARVEGAADHAAFFALAAKDRHP